ncbi:DUF2510 domain-containing protein [Mycobacterium sp.]|uniref:DUF2510 domain-containing protein n=1 Tax=Mycobacterium sp. TaxID=1785 RepID=UPI0039C958D4
MHRVLASFADQEHRIHGRHEFHRSFPSSFRHRPSAPAEIPCGRGSSRFGKPATATPLSPAAWYPDPRYPQFLRYWNGTAWTEHTAPDPRSTR